VIYEAIKALISMFIDWIWAVIRGMMEVVIKPIKDGITSWVRGISNQINNNIGDYQTNSNQNIILNGVIELIFGSFVWVLITLFTVVEAAISIASPFFSLVSGLMKDVVNFIKPLIINCLGLGGKEGGILGEDGWKSLTNWIYSYMGVEPSGQTKADEEFYNILNDFLFEMRILLSVLIASVGAIGIYLKIPGSSGKVVLAIFGLMLALASLFLKSSLTKFNSLIISGIGLLFSWNSYRKIPKNPNGCWGLIALGLCVSSCLISSLSFALYGLFLVDEAMKDDNNYQKYGVRKYNGIWDLLNSPA
jgi:hypothetical protein